MMEETLEKRGHEVDAIYQLAQLVNTGLDRKIIAIAMELIEYGVNPESIADVILEIRQQGP
jgi:mitotic-spindle organizing protein 1